MCIRDRRKNIAQLPEDVDVDKKLVSDMVGQGKAIIPEIQDALDEYFEEYEVMAVEMSLMEDIENESDHKFKGYIDAVVSTPDGKVHIFDWKTCSCGWNAQ